MIKLCRYCRLRRGCSCCCWPRTAWSRRKWSRLQHLTPMEMGRESLLIKMGRITTFEIFDKVIVEFEPYFDYEISWDTIIIIFLFLWLLIGSFGKKEVSSLSFFAFKILLTHRNGIYWDTIMKCNICRCDESQFLRCKLTMKFKSIISFCRLPKFRKRIVPLLSFIPFLKSNAARRPPPPGKLDLSRNFNWTAYFVWRCNFWEF